MIKSIAEVVAKWQQHMPSLRSVKEEEISADPKEEVNEGKQEEEEDIPHIPYPI